MSDKISLLKRLARDAGEVVAETLWPTRCALCDAPGAVLCDACARVLPHLDWWRACPRCGAPYGLRQCDLCNPVGMAKLGRDSLPFASCASAMLFTGRTGQLVRVFKDQGEQRLARVLAGYMAPLVAPGWQIDAVAFIPATKAAYRARGFDHAELMARELAGMLGLPLAFALERPRTRDQRALGGAGRVANLEGSFKTAASARPGARLLLVDDVMTTGATLCAATDALAQAGAAETRCLTFARV